MKEQMAIVGSCGKMGYGISELFLQRLPFIFKNYQLILIDNNPTLLQESKTLLRKNMRSFAEKNINKLRLFYQENTSLVSNQEMIETFVGDLFDHLTFSTHLESAKEAEWIFEAVSEHRKHKIELYDHLKKIVSKNALFFSNTSAIPIKEFGEGVIGFHFYNPPTHNQCLEIVAPEEYREIAIDLAKSLHKTYVFAGDIPGFIGNGHFIRELKFALELGLPAAEIDRMYERDLLRPFGPFRLAAFIGISTVVAIGEIMGIDCSAIQEIKIDDLKPHKIGPNDQPRLESTSQLLFENSQRIVNHLVTIGAAPDLESVKTVLKVGFHHAYV
jgi:3-hydroxyacyl-CoA dehydrogenase